MTKFGRITRRPWFWRRTHHFIAMIFGMSVISYVLVAIPSTQVASSAVEWGFSLLAASLGIYHLGKRNDPDHKD